MRTTPAETERNNQLILDAAIEVFAEKGYEATNMQDIATRAKISRGPLYYRYKTKLDLFLAAFETQALREMAEYRRILSQEKHILEIFREDLNFCTRNTSNGNLVPLLRIPNLPEMRPAQELTIRCSQEIFAMKLETVKRAIARGEMHWDTDPKRIVNMMFVFAQGLQPVCDQIQYRVVSSEPELFDAIEDLLYLIRSKYCVEQ